ncbi:MAG: biotin--[acetyl-CoA-carboxylase] ligase [Solirubrobacteraceae bacterium]
MLTCRDRRSANCVVSITVLDAPNGPQLGRPRLHLRRTGSTNERARALAQAGAPHGTLVTADEQTAGRGRQGRRWLAPPRSGLLVSLLLRFDRGSRAPALLSLAAGVAVCEVAGGQALVKWPNDVVVRRGEGARRAGDLGKLGGILIEGRPQEGWLVLGIGVNVALDLERLPAEVRAGAASLSLGSDAVEPFLERLLTALRRRLEAPAEATLEAWRRRDALRGARIRWNGGEGRAEGVDGAGRLLVELEDGERVALDSGEVHLLR